MPAKYQPYLKAIAPALFTLIAVVGQWVATGEFGRAEFATALTGALTSLLTFVVPNAAPESEFTPEELRGEEVER